MSKFTEIEDSGTAPGFPSVKQMRKSQADGNQGVGLNEQSFLDDLRDFNQGVSINGAKDTETPSGASTSLPWKP